MYRKRKKSRDFLRFFVFDLECIIFYLYLCVHLLHAFDTFSDEKNHEKLGPRMDLAGGIVVHADGAECSIIHNG